MNVVYVSNEAYVRHLAASLCSLYDNNKEEDLLNVFVLSTGIEEASAAKLEKIASDFGRELSVVQAGDLTAKFSYTIDTGRFDISTMGRLFLGDLLPENVERVIYLDCDTVVLRSLKKLWELPLPGKYVLAAAQEPTIYREVKEYLGLSEEEPYFNAGVLLIDLKKYREEKLTEKILSYYSTVAEQSLFNDQDALNGCLKGRIRGFSPVYNFVTNYKYFRYQTLTGMQSSYLKVPEKLFRAAKKSPAVVHYAGDERPWKRGAMNPYGRFYDKYLGMTPFRGTPKETGSELHLLMYHVMDLGTLVCPAARAAVSRWYIKKEIAARAARQAAANAEKEKS